MSPIRVGPKDFACPFCPKRTKTKNNMTQHIRIHTGEKPYKCQHCPYAGTYKHDLDKHIKKYHMSN